MTGVEIRFSISELSLIGIGLGCLPTYFASADTDNIFGLRSNLKFPSRHHMGLLAIHVERFTLTDTVSGLETETFPLARITRTLARIIRNQ